MKSSTFETYYRNAGIFDELFNEQFAVVILPVFQRRKSAYSKNVKILSHYRSSIFYMLNRIAAHDCFFLKFQCPAFTSYIKNDRLHAKVLCRYLRTQPCAHTWIEKQAPDPFIGTQHPVFEGIGFIGQCLLNKSINVGYVIN